MDPFHHLSVFICIYHFTICSFHRGPLAFFDDVYPRATLCCIDLKFHPLRLFLLWQGTLLSGEFGSQVRSGGPVVAKHARGPPGRTRPLDLYLIL